MLILISSHGTDCSSIKYVPFQLTIRLSTNILLNVMSLIEITIYGFKDSSVNLLTGSYVHPEDFLKRLRFVSFTRWPYSHPDLLVTHHCFSGSRWSPLTIYNIYLRILAASHCSLIKGTILNTARQHSGTDLEFVKKFTRPNFRVKEFYTLKTRQSRLFSPVINSKNASLSVIWPSFGSNWTKCVNSLIVMKKYYIEVCVNLQNM